MEVCRESCVSHSVKVQNRLEKIINILGIPAFIFFLFPQACSLYFYLYQKLFFRKESNTYPHKFNMVILHISISSYLKSKMLKCSNIKKNLYNPLFPAQG